MKNQYRIKTIRGPISIGKVTSKKYVDKLVKDPSVLWNTGHVDFKNQNHENVRFVKITSHLAVGENLTANFNVVEAFSIV